MSDMTPEKATALRKPFPAESVGKLPKGGAMLDYVGHAAVTDRLLTVDPHWSWEPFALTPEGLPAVDKAGNLWIRLTICGVTRIGVGDGKNAKEVVGDAIRNAAMRFGVALDLWAKENLVEFAQAARAHQTGAGALRAALQTEAAAAGRPVDDATAASVARGLEQSAAGLAGPLKEERADTQPAEPMTAKTRATMFALFGDLGITDRDAQIAGIVHVIGHPIASRGDLTEAEAQAVVRRLKDKKAGKA